MPQIENVQPFDTELTAVTSFGFGFTVTVEALAGFRFRDGTSVTEISCGGSGAWVGAHNASGRNCVDVIIQSCVLKVV